MPPMKKPADTTLKQQRMGACKPVLTPKTIFPVMLVLAIILCVVGVLLKSIDGGLVEHIVDYTSCKNAAGEDCSAKYQAGCTCEAAGKFTIEKELSEAFIYYEISNFHQNHRRYLLSRDDALTMGKTQPDGQVSEKCVPWAYAPAGAKKRDYRPVEKNTDKGPIRAFYKERKSFAAKPNDNDKIIAPCGAVPNAFFNDTFKLVTAVGTDVAITRKGIRWPVDSSKFKNPDDLPAFAAATVPPLSWTFLGGKGIDKLDPEDESNNGFLWEPYNVWARSSPFPTFRHLYGKVETLAEGEYTVKVNYTWPASETGSTKKMILMTTSFMGGKSQFLPILCIGCGVFAFANCVICIILQVMFGKKSWVTLANEAIEKKKGAGGS